MQGAHAHKGQTPVADAQDGPLLPLLLAGSQSVACRKSGVNRGAVMVTIRRVLETYTASFATDEEIAPTGATMVVWRTPDTLCLSNVILPAHHGVV
jgi:hypothetical protein